MARTGAGIPLAEAGSLACIPAIPTAPADTDLLHGVARQDSHCLELLYARDSRLVFSLACRIARDTAVAEDATQETFVQAWREAPRFDETRGTVRMWLVMIARTRTLDQIRARTRRAQATDEAGIDARALPRCPSPEDRASEWEQAGAIQSVMSLMTPADRRCIEMAFFEGMTHTEIAKSLRQPLGTVKTQIRRVLGVMRSALRDSETQPFSWLGEERLNQGSAPLQGIRILIADDDDERARVLTFVLNRAGAAIRTVRSVSEGVQRMQRAPPDLLLADLDTTQLDSPALLTQARSMTAGSGRLFRAVALIGKGRSGGPPPGSGNFDLQLPKPVRPPELIAHVCRLAARDHAWARGR